ncbi:MAG: acyl-ACP--UDP-N-acetylglucosamine O-acyltransferase [Puniceicoccales bacterium]|jgi:UDP-N-acetylglucosamine acyltransferase|nr:acyl-ACP--UDP-N-acetylglucosamine O-acyltransferase [Puniceicoccales bacterium]
MSNIHPSAIVSDSALLEDGVTIGPYSIIGEGVKLGSGTTVLSHCSIHRCTIGNHCLVDNFSTLGGLPQIAGFDSTKAGTIIIGDNTVVREHVTLSTASAKDKLTKIGNHCLLMACSHVGHDCTLENNITLANSALLGGHVHLQNDCFIGGNSAIHQGCLVGAGTIISGISGASKHVPPHSIIANRNELIGLNLIGLRRRGVSSAAISELSNHFTIIFKKMSGRLEERAEKLLSENKIEYNETLQFLKFFRNKAPKGFCTPRK